MKRAILALAAAALCIPAVCGAEGIPPGGKSLQLSKVILDTDIPEVKGKLKVGTICLLGGGPIKLNKSKHTENYERYDNLFSPPLKAHGFAVVSTSGDLFAEEGAGPKGDYLIGATLKPDTINMCNSVNGQKGDITMAVEWKIYDRAAQKVVETVTTTGHGVQEKFARDGLNLMWNKAFVDSLDALIAKGVLQKYVGQPGH